MTHPPEDFFVCQWCKFAGFKALSVISTNLGVDPGGDASTDGGSTSQRRVQSLLHPTGRGYIMRSSKMGVTRRLEGGNETSLLCCRICDLFSPSEIMGGAQTYLFM